MTEEFIRVVNRFITNEIEGPSPDDTNSDDELIVDVDINSHILQYTYEITYSGDVVDIMKYIISLLRCDKLTTGGKINDSVFFDITHAYDHFISHEDRNKHLGPWKWFKKAHSNITAAILIYLLDSEEGVKYFIYLMDILSKDDDLLYTGQFVLHEWIIDGLYKNIPLSKISILDHDYWFHHRDGFLCTHWREYDRNNYYSEGIFLTVIKLKRVDVIRFLLENKWNSNSVGYEVISRPYSRYDEYDMYDIARSTHGINIGLSTESKIEFMTAGANICRYVAEIWSS